MVRITRLREARRGPMAKLGLGAEGAVCGWWGGGSPERSRVVGSGGGDVRGCGRVRPCLRGGRVEHGATRKLVGGLVRLLAFVASRIRFADAGSERARYTPGCLVVVFAGLAGGPSVGVVAGLAAAHRFRDAKANLFWSSEASVIGCVAGLIGLSSMPLAARVVLAFAAVR